MPKTPNYSNIPLLSDDAVMAKIYFVRGQKVMFDSDLAALYGVETKRLKEQVRRNKARFPYHFMFELTRDEYSAIQRSQNATLNSKYLPFVFTEYGVLMLSNILKSEQATQVSIRIIDVFVKLSAAIANYTELRAEVEALKNEIRKQTDRQNNQDTTLELVFQYLDELANKKEPVVNNRNEIGFKIGSNEYDT